MEVIQQLSLVAFIFLAFITGAEALRCSFETSNGILQHKYCRERCCDGPDVRYSTVCCNYKRGNEIYIGTGMATLIVLTIFILCSTYICCRRNILRQSRNSDLRQNNTRLTPRGNNILPTVSEQVQPPVPPPYESLPPPYYTDEQSSNFKKENTPSLPDGPPPAYSPYETCVT